MPPVTTASASPDWIIRVAAPIACAPAAQADTDRVGLAAQAVAHGDRAGAGVAHHQRHGERRDALGARVAQDVLVCSSVPMPPMPVPMMQPTRSGS